jgi:hypothetical protein
MTGLNEYALGNKIYIDLKEILPLRPYAKGCNSISKLIQRKGFDDVINGRIVDGVLCRTEKKSCKYGSAFVNKSEVSDLFSSPTEINETIPIEMNTSDIGNIKQECDIRLHLAQLEISEAKRECDIRIHMMRLELDEMKRSCDVRIHMMKLELNDIKRENNTKLYRSEIDLISAHNTIDMLRMRIHILESQKNVATY